MVHVLAILFLGLACALWVVIQKAAGSLESGGAGRCGLCGGEGGGECKRPGNPTCKNRTPDDGS